MILDEWLLPAISDANILNFELKSLNKCLYNFLYSEFFFTNQREDIFALKNMKSSIYELYQGEDLDITLRAKDSTDQNVDISSLEIEIAFVNSSQTQIILSNQNQGIKSQLSDNHTLEINISSGVTSTLPQGDYLLSVILTKDKKRVIEQVQIFRVLKSIHGRG